MIEREKLMFENQLDASTQLLEILPKFDNALLV